MIGFCNGKYMPVNEITIPADSLAVNRGFGAYDFFSVINGIPFYLDRHIHRFKETLRLLKFDNKHLHEIDNIIKQLIAYNKTHQSFGIKLFALPTQESNPPLNTELYALPTQLIKFNNNDYQNGCKLILREYKRFLPEAKSTAYLASQYYKDEIDKFGAADVLYHDNGFIRETSRGNFFLVKNNIVFTPKNEVLKGITQSVLFDIMNEASIPYKVEDINLEQMRDADEVFVTSSTKLVLPIVNIDGLKINQEIPGELSKQLLKLFLQHKEENCGI